MASTMGGQWLQPDAVQTLIRASLSSPQRGLSLAVKRCVKICNNIRWRISQLNSILPRLGRSPSYLGTLGFGAPCSANYPYVRDSAGDIYGTWGCLSERTVNNDFWGKSWGQRPQKKNWKDEQKKRESKILLHKKQYKFYPDSVWAQAKKYKMFYAYDHCNCSTNKRERVETKKKEKKEKRI